MVDAAKLSRARTVENVNGEPMQPEAAIDELALGTKVGDHELSTNRDTLFPLQAALAYEVSQSLFAADHSVLVEGPWDVLYFQWFKRKLSSMGRTTLDDRWVVTPCGGIDKVAAFVSLLAGKQMHIAVITDYATSQKTSVPYLQGTELLRHGHVLTIDSYAGKEQAGIEDVIGGPAYVELVRHAYDLTEEMVRPIAKSSKSTVPVTKEVEDFLASLPERSGDFDRYRPAEFLIQQGADFTLPDLDQALNRFESLFGDLNAMLN